MRQGFDYTKEIPKYTKENMPADCFGSHFSQNGAINVISRPNCHIFNYLSIDTHIGYSHSHMAIWLYGHMVRFWPYGHIWEYGHMAYGSKIWVSMETALQM